MKHRQTPSGFYLKLNLRIKRLEKLAGVNKRHPFREGIFGSKPTPKAGVGFTGSRNGTQNKVQLDVLKRLLENLCVRTGCYEEMLVEHGDCLGWDQVCHKIARKMHLRVFIHPPKNPTYRAFCDDATFVFPEKPYLDRNKSIVDRTQALIAVPSTMREEQRSGTWSTVRYARKQGKRIFIILPNGALISEL